MQRGSRLLLFAALPLFTLALGWQLGMRFEQQRQFDRLGDWIEQDSGSGSIAADPESEVDLDLFWRVWRLLLQNHIEPASLETRTLYFGAIRGLVEAVGDPYTVFMTPEENEEFHDSLDGQLEGIGAQLELKENEIVVIAPIKGSPAERAGLLPQDIIVTVDGEDITGQALHEVITKIRGPKGTKVTIEVYREGKNDLIPMTITRDEITVPSVESELKSVGAKKIGVLSVNQFGTDTIRDVRTALQDLTKTPLDGIVLDLRFNGGGYLDGAVDLVSFFLKEGKVVSVAQREGAPLHHYVSGRPLLSETPLVVLINQGSASASEITAGAIQDLKRGTIIGMQSFGKGTVQEVIDLPMKTSLRVTTAKWLTPSGRDISKHGVTPDIIVDRTEDDYEADRDPQMDAALEFLTTGKVVNVRTGTGSTK